MNAYTADSSRRAPLALNEMERRLGDPECLSQNIYWDPTFDARAAKVLPGEYFASADDMVMVTVLGSCVSACVRDAGMGIGGMNHFMLPEDGSGVTSSSARYGVYAMEVLINHLVKLGARRHRLEAKIFGGGAVMSSLASSNIGERNAEFVTRFLATECIPIVAQDLLDAYPRKVYFFPRTGRVLVRKLHRIHNDTLFQRERSYRERLRREPVSGSVELF